jgi:putative phosphoribosyl transferase
MIFKDRYDAGRKLVPRLVAYKGQKETIVIGLARGGVVTAFEVAEGLELPLGVLVVRKIGAPDNEELALGAITEMGEGIFNEDLIDALGASREYINQTIEREKKVAAQRSALYRGKKPAPTYTGKTVILVDDGIATGATMFASIKAMRKAGAKKIIVAIPVAAPDSLRRLEKEADEAICLSAPAHFFAVGAFYEQFGQTRDEEIIQLLAKAKH